MKTFLIAIFGKYFFRWQGKQEIKEQVLFTKLSIFVAQDSVKELGAQIAQNQSVLDTKAQPPDVQEDLANKIADLKGELEKITNKIAEYQQTLINLKYKSDLLNRL